MATAVKPAQPAPKTSPPTMKPPAASAAGGPWWIVTRGDQMKMIASATMPDIKEELGRPQLRFLGPYLDQADAQKVYDLKNHWLVAKYNTGAVE